MKLKLIEKFRKRTAHIAVVGLGRVGLPTSAVFAGAGFNVIGVDVRGDVIQDVSRGRVRANEQGLEELLQRVVNSGRLRASTESVGVVAESDAVVVCVQTPIDDQRRPDLTYLKSACNEVAQGFSEGKLVIIVSTVPPGTMKNVVVKILEDKSGLKCGADFWLVYCPERITPGKILQEFATGDRIVGSFDKDSATVAAELLKTVTSGDLPITDCGSAEVAKLAENTFRDVNIAFANELALICESVGVDVIEAIRLANTHPRVRIHWPGCGVGGPCLTKDPYLLLHSKTSKHVGFGVVKASRELNDLMPTHTVKLVKAALKEIGKDVSNSRIAVLGVAYKGDTEDATNSPAEKMIHELIDLGATIAVYDPYCEETFGGEKVQNVAEAFIGSDCIVVAADHKMFRKLELKNLKAQMNEKPIIVDGKRVIDPNRAQETGFLYYGVGYQPR